MVRIQNHPKVENVDITGVDEDDNWVVAATIVGLGTREFKRLSLSQALADCLTTLDTRQV